MSATENLGPDSVKQVALGTVPYETSCNGQAAPQWSTERKNIEGYAEESLELRDYASVEREELRGRGASLTVSSLNAELKSD
ncbi:predicted protein [Histoplasma mississippiense (nom. inval.)]|uniref:predicted protein n=1 Tax=Ajellomyces capsulatus (strain NAm1 / WU24) TaxID=2059318 RepID=UPI000157D138|nr:predicted protein [Histoplasma mississippiense (nom. inval.)]EDN11295.1 predicted protein [Histoplasma mississippiense (nom. inval.)]